MMIIMRFEDIKSSTERELFEYSAARKIRVLHRFLIYDRVATSSHIEFDVYGIYHNISLTVFGVVNSQIEILITNRSRYLF